MQKRLQNPNKPTEWIPLEPIDVQPSAGYLVTLLLNDLDQLRPQDLGVPDGALLGVHGEVEEQPVLPGAVDALRVHDVNDL